MIKTLIEKGVSKVYATDITKANVDRAKEELGNPGICDFSVVNMGDNSILEKDNVDIVSPCAGGGVLNPETIPKIKAGIICGAANN